MSSSTPSATARSSMPAAPAAQASADSRSAVSASAARAVKHAKIGLVAALCLPSLLTAGCYLGHVAAGQVRLMRARQPIEEVLADPRTSPDLRRQLGAVQRARAYAQTLGLDVDEQYTSYVDWPGDRVVTSVIATRPGEVTPAGFWFPFLGRVPYKGFFDQARAEAEAEKLVQRGLDVCIVAVPAYSTLGWLEDPVTAPMLRRGEGETIETIFHELVHATVYVKDHVDFDETVASFIGQEASVRFYEHEETPEAADARRGAVRDERALSAILVGLRARVEALYASSDPGPERDAARSRLATEARAEIAALPLRERDPAELAGAIQLNDACLAFWGTYGSGMDRYVAKLDALGGDLPAFIVQLREAADAPDPEAALLGP
jgi:predicted aminopeptidase